MYFRDDPESAIANADKVIEYTYDYSGGKDKEKDKDTSRTASAMPSGFHGARFSGSFSTTLSPAQPTPNNAASSFSGTGTGKANNLVVSQAAFGNAAPFGSPNSNASPRNNLSTFQSNPFETAPAQQQQRAKSEAKPRHIYTVKRTGNKNQPTTTAESNDSMSL
jgi:hypothetical protein